MAVPSALQAMRQRLPAMRRLEAPKKPEEPPEFWSGRLVGVPPPASLAGEGRGLSVVICPGFGNDAVDYMEPLGLPSECGLCAALERRGLVPRVVPVARSDWLRVAGGLLDAEFRRGEV